jgi:hypothetical protein
MPASFRHPPFTSSRLAAKAARGEVRLPTEKTWLVGSINDQKNSRQKKIAWQPCPRW